MTIHSPNGRHPMMTASIAADQNATMDLVSHAEFRPRSLPMNIAHSVASLWADPSDHLNKNNNNNGSKAHLHSRGGGERIRSGHRKRTPARTTNRLYSMPTSPNEEPIIKRARTTENAMDNRNLYIDPKTESREAMFSKPSPLMKLMQCCERLLSEQKPAPFRSVLPDGYMEEVIGSTVMIPSPNRSKHSATAVPSSTHVIGQVFSALDDLLCGHSVLGSSSRHDNRVCYPPDPTIQLWSGMTNGPMIPKLPLWPMIPITQLTNLSGIEAPVEQVTVPTPCEDNASSLTLMSSQPISEPCSIAHVHDLRLHERIIKSTSNTSSVIDKELLSSQSIVSPTATSFGNGLPPVVSENQKQKDNSQSSFQVENYADSNCTTFHGVHLQNQGNATAPYSSLTMLANLMLLTTLLQQVAVAPAGLNPTSSPTVCSDISKTRINSMESRGSIGEPIAVIEATNPNVANPLLWPRPQSPVVLSTLLSLLAAPPVRITKP